jgi:hypothetical protein
VTDDYMPDPERTVAYKLLDPGFTKVFAFGTQFGQTGFIIADSWEDAYEELLEYAYEVDGPCDHGDDPELAALIATAEATPGPANLAAWEACNEWVDEHCDCTTCQYGYVWMVDSWWLHHQTNYHPYALVKALIAHPPTNGVATEQLDTLLEWYEPGEDEH